MLVKFTLLTFSSAHPNAPLSTEGMAELRPLNTTASIILIPGLSEEFRSCFAQDFVNIKNQQL